MQRYGVFEALHQRACGKMPVHRPRVVGQTAHIVLGSLATLPKRMVMYPCN